MTRKVGRPRKKYAPGERPTILSVAIPEALSSAIPSTSNISREFTTYLQLRYGGKGKEEIELQFLREQIGELENKLAVLRAQEEIIIERQKREDEEKRALLFQQDAIAHFLRQRIINISKNTYDLDFEVREIRNNAGIIISKNSLLNAIRTGSSNPERLKEGGELLIELGVTLAPNCQKTVWWNSIMDDYRKYREAKA